MAPLICFDVVEFHHPDRVLRQFGQHQTIPAVCDTIRDIHLTDRRGRQNYDWAHHHRQFVDMWSERCARVVSGPPIDGPVDLNDPYMVWYRRITRLLIGNPATRPNTGYQGVGGALETMVQNALIRPLSLLDVLMPMFSFSHSFNISRRRAYRKFITVPLILCMKAMRSPGRMLLGRSRKFVHIL